MTLDTQGRLEKFWAKPKRFSSGPPVAEEPDWSVAFAFAELNMAAFTPVEPRRDASMIPEVRAAWVGTLPDFPQGRVRIEAGMSGGRIVLFEILDEDSIERLAADPQPSGVASVEDLSLSVLMAIVLIAGGFLARRNLRRGRADRRGAVRIAGFVFMAQCLALVLDSHRFWSRDMWLLWWPIVGTGAMIAGTCWVFYVALEPYARRVWPSILPAWSRLVSGARWRVRDPQVGRSMLVGLVAAGLICLLYPVLERVLQMQGAPPDLYALEWNVVLGQRYVFARFFQGATNALAHALGCALILVAGRFFLRSRVAAVLLLGAVLILLLYGRTEDLLWAFPAAVILITVLIRFGLLALTFCWAFVEAQYRALTTDWTAWHGQNAVIYLVLVALLAAYGFWAATAGRPLLAERDG